MFLRMAVASAPHPAFWEWLLMPGVLSTGTMGFHGELQSERWAAQDCILQPAQGTVLLLGGRTAGTPYQPCGPGFWHWLNT
jgi:hypothetical protein